MIRQETRWRQLARKLGMGRVLYRTVYAPAGFLRRCRREGWINLMLSRRGRAQMTRAAARLPALPATPAAAALEVHFLSGRHIWYQTAFCAWSLLRHTGGTIRPVIQDDGTLAGPTGEQLRRLLPTARFISAAEIEERLDQALPRSRYPALRHRRDSFPLLRKLTDIHAGSPGWKLFLDSDMLFFRQPTFLLDWLRAPDRPCYMLDIANAYGHSEALMQELAGHPIPSRVNTGLCGLRNEDIDWDRLEYWSKHLIERDRMRYLHEQALTAMLLAGRTSAIAPEDAYIALPSRQEAMRPTAVMHHYVAESKAWYFRYAWHQALAS